jgi:hypothetical protein
MQGFEWLSRHPKDFVCRLLGYYRDEIGVELEIGIMADGERVARVVEGALSKDRNILLV